MDRRLSLDDASLVLCAPARNGHYLVRLPPKDKPRTARFGTWEMSLVVNPRIGLPHISLASHAIQESQTEQSSLGTPQVSTLHQLLPLQLSVAHWLYVSHTSLPPVHTSD